jgi:hypothetical protein
VEYPDASQPENLPAIPMSLHICQLVCVETSSAVGNAVHSEALMVDNECQL